MSESKELLAPAPSGACAPMTDAEVICTWMEPKPRTMLEAIPAKWWYAFPELGAHPRELDLDALWEVEERLPLASWAVYVEGLMIWKDLLPKVYVEQYRALIHATPEQKIKALAAVLRPLVTGARGADATRASNEDGGR